jgi:hypothetical protein
LALRGWLLFFVLTKSVQAVAEANGVLAPKSDPPFVIQEDLGLVRFFFSLQNFQTTPDDPSLIELAGYFGCSVTSKIVVDMNFSHGSEPQSVTASILKSEVWSVVVLFVVVCFYRRLERGKLQKTPL